MPQGLQHPSGSVPSATVTPLSRPAADWTRFLEAIRYRGVYPTRQRAEEAARLVIAGLSRQLDASVRAQLAAALPAEAARLLKGEEAAARPLSGRAFVAELAARAGTGLAQARWDTGSVLTVVAELTGPDLLDRVLDRLPPGHALLFGRAELSRPA
ncbi:hypothetical protein EES44_17740 [Streptomyces sp. ADI96-15]|nr:Hypothetical protein B591_02284 [Streptomyces sp. GBA 94-10 4N24]RPK62278.1 hypothetical protein EES44_17740 [Streptomyces sp. ADI96-15]UZN57484.1 Hypothetical protein B591N_02284 [Streptomyces sp. GBA 94-10 4N24]